MEQKYDFVLIFSLLAQMERCVNKISELNKKLGESWTEKTQ